MGLVTPIGDIPYTYFIKIMQGNTMEYIDEHKALILAQNWFVIGYLGMTGYSIKENVNNISTPHLHFGIQLIFDESQKESDNEIWIDISALTSILEVHQSSVVRNNETKEFTRKFNFNELE